MNEEINYFKIKVHQLENKQEGDGVGERKYQKNRESKERKTDKERKRGREGGGREGGREGGEGKLLIMKQIPSFSVPSFKIQLNTLEIIQQTMIKQPLKV